MPEPTLKERQETLRIAIKNLRHFDFKGDHKGFIEEVEAIMGELDEVALLLVGSESEYAKKQASQAGNVLKAMLKGNFQDFWNLPAPIKSRLVIWAGTSMPAEKGEEDQEPSAKKAREHLQFLVNLLVSEESINTPEFKKPLAGLKEAINKEIKRLS